MGVRRKRRMKAQADGEPTRLRNGGSRRIGRPRSGPTGRAEDQNIVLRRFAPKIAELNARNVCFVPDTDDISDEYFLPLVKIMAYDCASAFGVTGRSLPNCARRAARMAKRNGHSRTLFAFARQTRR